MESPVGAGDAGGGKTGGGGNGNGMGMGGAVGSGTEELSPLEMQVLEEYERLSGNMRGVCFSSLSLS